MTYRLFILIVALFAFVGCKSPTSAIVIAPPEHVKRIDTNRLIVLYPKFSKIDLVCGEMPTKQDSTVILVAGAAYTGGCLDKFHHTNIAGDHVSRGVKYKGYRCARNSGAFVFYNGTAKFCKQPYTNELDSAAKYGGAAFGQELMLHNGEIQHTYRKDHNKNQFRALCKHNDQVCIIESDSIVSLGHFKQQLKAFGVSDALYLDMGGGWNYAWYRYGNNVVELHHYPNKYSTNWITFYK